MPGLMKNILCISALLALIAACNESADQTEMNADSGLSNPTASPSASISESDVTAADRQATARLLAQSGTAPAVDELRHLGYCVEFCSKCGDSRGENSAPPRDEPVRINFNFLGVRYNEDAKANMSTLDFELVGQWKNRERLRTSLSMDDRLQEEFPLVDVGLCQLRVEPQLSEVVETAIRNRGPNDYKTYGAYHVTVTDPEGDLVGEFPLDGRGNAGDPQWQNTKQSKYHIGKIFKRDTDQWRFDIRRMDDFRESQYDAPVLFGMVFQQEGTLRRQDFAPDMTRHEYRFPAVGVDIYTPEAIRGEELAALEREKAERDVEYYSAAGVVDRIQPRFVFNGGGSGGGGGFPGCGGGG